MEVRENDHIYNWKPLASKVIICASVNIAVGDWTVYIDAVPGKNNMNEWKEVARNGTKVDQAVGEYYFAKYKGVFRWRP